MLLRKINAVISLFTTILLLNHAIFLTIWMLSRGSLTKSNTPVPIILTILMVLHGLISIVLAFLGHKGAEKGKYNTYTKMNIATIIQRSSGIIMLLLIALHIAGALNKFQPMIIHAILHPVFFAAALMHTCVSVSKGLITLGIGNTKTVKIVDIITKVICGATFIASVIGFYICMFMGVAK